jgi:acetolactate synthase-1/2/3 large subunit
MDNMNPCSSHHITVGELIARFLEAANVKSAFGVISIHNMPILDAFHRRQNMRFISSRGEAGACNMADAYARATGGLGVFVTSTGTGAGNAAGGLIEAYTAGTPLMHLTGQIESEFVDQDLGYIHEAPAQLAMLKAVGKGAFRIRNAASALSVLQEAYRLAMTAPRGPVSIEIPIDVQARLLPVPQDLEPAVLSPMLPDPAKLNLLYEALRQAKRPLLWLGGGARRASGGVQRLVRLGFGVVTSVQGRGILEESHPHTLGSYNLQKPVELFYQTCDAMLVVGSRLRSNETLKYQLRFPKRLYRIDADALAQNKGYESDLFVLGDAALSLDALADLLEQGLPMQIDKDLIKDLGQAKQLAQAQVDDALGPYGVLKQAVQNVAQKGMWWVRDITLSNTMWGNRAPALHHPRAGVHALGGGIGQGLPMAIGVSLANEDLGLKRQTLLLCGDGGLVLNMGELACAVQERAQMVILLMNDKSYGVIRNIQDDIYGARHCYVDLHNPNFKTLCESLGLGFHRLEKEGDVQSVLEKAFQQTQDMQAPVLLEVDMTAWGPFKIKFAGPILKKDQDEK